MKIQSYTINRAAKAPSLNPAQGVPAKGWNGAEVGVISKWHKASGPIRPATLFRVLYDDRNLYVRFDVLDQFVQVVKKNLNDNVCEDSCVEFFVQPAPGPTYFNFEINGGGTMLLYRITDAARTERDGQTVFKDYGKVDPAWAAQVEIHHSLPALVAEPIAQPISWTVAYRIPLALFTAYIGKCAAQKGDVWRGNFFKCGASGHYGMWRDIGEELNYHQPDKFGNLVFG